MLTRGEVPKSHTACCLTLCRCHVTPTSSSTTSPTSPRRSSRVAPDLPTTSAVLRGVLMRAGNLFGVLHVVRVCGQG